MDGQYGVETVKGFLSQIGQGVAVAYGVFVQKQSYFHLVALVDVVKALKSADFAKLGLELKDMSDAERVEVESSFTAALPMSLASKLGPFVTYSEKLVLLVEKVVNFGKSGYQEVQLLVQEFKVLFGIA